MNTLKMKTRLFATRKISAGISPVLAMAPLALLLGVGCTHDDPPKEDMAMAADLAAAPRDMARPGADLAVASDMAVNSDMAGTGDMAIKTDMATMPVDMASVGDLSVKPDLSSGTPDLSTPAGDMAMGPVVTGLPACTITGVTADIVYNDVVKSTCAAAMCHAAKYTSGATLKSTSVGVASGQTTLMPVVTAGNVDRSYMMYKLTGQHLGVGGRGEAMPKGGMRLTDANLCKFIVWIKEGAN